jgi:SAM-dependent methyltransferase
MDFLHLDFPPGSFDAVFAMNCLLHVPNHDLPAVLESIRGVLRPGGLFFVGVYGGDESAEGPIDDDRHVPPRFFSWRTDEQLLGLPLLRGSMWWTSLRSIPVGATASSR